MLAVNAVLQPHPAFEHGPLDHSYVVALLQPGVDRLFGVELTGVRRQPRCFALSAVRHWLDTDQIICSTLDLPDWMLRADVAFPRKTLDSRDRSFESIRPIVDRLEEFLLGSERNRLVQERAKELGCSRETLYRRLNRFLRHGQHINALLPEYHRCGCSSPEGRGSVKRGAPRRDGFMGRNVAAEDVRNIEFVIRKWYLPTDSRRTLKDCYYEMLLPTFYSTGQRAMPTGKVTPALYDHDDRPSLHQFRYYARKFLDRSGIRPGQIRRARSEYQKDFEGRTGTAPRPEGPGHVFQLDSTPLDMELRSRFCSSQTLLVGRATVYQVIDAFSNVTVGLYVCLGEPSWANARLALYCAIRRKGEAFFAELGMELPEEDLPEGGVPQILFVDNQEFATALSETVGRDLQIIVQYGRARRGDDKGPIEFELGQLNLELKSLDGYIPKDRGRPGRRNPKRDALFTLEEVYQHLMRIVINRNHHRDLPYERLDEQMIRDGVAPTAMSIWRWGIRHRPWLGKVMDDRQLYLSLLERGVARVEREGLIFEGCIYVCQEVRDLGLQDRKPRRHCSPQLEVRYLRHTARYIIVVLPDGSFAWATLSARFQRFLRCSFDEIEIRLHEEAREKAARETPALEHKLAVKEEMAEKAKAARAQRERLTPGEVSRQPIAEQRAQEKGVEVLRDADRFEAIAESELGAVDPGAEPSPGDVDEDSGDPHAESTSSYWESMSDVLMGDDDAG